jgi:peptidoglycan hydrolase CwlO-like protein
MTKRAQNSILAALKREQKKLSDSRDALRDLVSVVEEQFENVDGALDDLETAISRLSELV